MAKSSRESRKLPVTERKGWTLTEWAALRGLSRTSAYEARRRGETPEEIHIGGRVIVTAEADAAWARRMQRGAA